MPARKPSTSSSPRAARTPTGDRVADGLPPTTPEPIQEPAPPPIEKPTHPPAPVVVVCQVCFPDGPQGDADAVGCEHGHWQLRGDR